MHDQYTYPTSQLFDGYRQKVQELEAEIKRLRYALKIIAGRERCLDPCMGNVDIAIAALAQEGGHENMP